MGENCFSKNYLKPLEVNIQEYEGTGLQENLVKLGKNWESAVLAPRSIHSLLTPSSARQKRHSRWAQLRTQAPCPCQLPVSGLASYKEHNTSMSPPGYSYLLQRWRHRQGQLGGGEAFYAQPPTCGMETPLSTVPPGLLGSWMPLPWLKRLPCHRQSQAKKNRGRCPSPKGSIPKQSTT